MRSTWTLIFYRILWGSRALNSNISGHGQNVVDVGWLLLYKVCVQFVLLFGFNRYWLALGDFGIPNVHSLGTTRWLSMRHVHRKWEWWNRLLNCVQRQKVSHVYFFVLQIPWKDCLWFLRRKCQCYLFFIFPGYR